MRWPPAPLAEPQSDIARSLSSSRAGPQQNRFRTAKAIPFLFFLTVSCFPAHADIFVDIFYPVHGFEFDAGPYEAGPYDWLVLKEFEPNHPLNRFPTNIDYTVPIQCDEIAKQAERVNVFSAAVLSSVAAAEAALKVNDREAASGANLQASKSLRSMKAAKGFLDVMSSRPIKGPFRTREKSGVDPLENFLMWAAIIGVEDSSWIKDLQLMTIDSSLPIEFRRMQKKLSHETRDAWVAGKFAVTNAPALGPWLASVGRTVAAYPLTVTDLIRGFDLTLNLTQGPYCSALHERDGEILSFEVGHSSPVFGGQRVITKVRFGQGRRESSSEAAARVEGRNKALDYLLGNFIKDVLDTNHQEYRVSDAVLGDFDGGAYLPGAQFDGWGDWRLGSTCEIKFDNKDVTIEFRSLREALNLMNGELGAVSFNDVNSALGKEDRYHGSRFKVHLRNHGYSVPSAQEFVEFAFASGATPIRMGFMPAGGTTRINVAYVISKETLLYVHPGLLAGLRNRPDC